MTDKFNKAIKFVLDAEGGYTNHPNDPGGETNFGIDKRSNPEVDIKNLTKEKAIEIYFRKYWELSSAESLPQPLFLSYFDSVVNTGRKQANKFLQRALGVVADGVVGPVTLKAAAAADPIKTAYKLIDQRQTFYENLCDLKPSLSVFLKGWTNRNNNLRNYIKNLT